MRKLSLAIAFLFAAVVSAYAQFNGCGFGFCAIGGNGQSTYEGPNDVVTGAVQCGALRACSITNIGAAAAELLRASDSHTCDVLIASNGGLGVTANCSTSGDNGTAVTSWCNATTCSVQKLYDQTEHNNLFENFTSSRQPTLTFNCLNTNLPCMDSNTGTAQLGGGTTLSALGYTAFAVYKSAFGGSVGYIYAPTTASSGSAANYIAATATANQVAINSGASLTASATDNAWHAVAALFAAIGNSSLWVDDVLTSGSAGTTLQGPSGSEIFAAGNSSAFFDGKITEVLVYPSGLTATQVGLICHNQRAYWGTSGSC